MFKEKILADVKQAMKNKESEKTSFLRSLISAFNNEAIELKKKEEGLTEAEEIKVLKREAKKHKDSISQYSSAGRNDLVQIEQAELDILQTYLPEEMSEDKVKEIVEKIISDMGEVAPSQFGEVMKKVMTETQGQADGSVISKIVKEALNK